MQKRRFLTGQGRFLMVSCCLHRVRIRFPFCDILCRFHFAPAVLLAPLLLAKQTEGLRKNEAAEAKWGPCKVAP